MNMLKVRTGMLTTLLVGLGVLGLAGCGGDTPTATPVAVPTATTATTMEEPTATTGTVMEEPTATEAAMEEPTATEAMEEPTATTGTSGSGDSTANALLAKSESAMKALKTYHVSMNIESSAGGATAEVDVSRPDSYRMVLDSSGVSTEVIIIGNSSYVKVPGGDQYIETPADASMLSALSTTSVADLAQDTEVVGKETINGVETTHVTFMYDANAAASMVGATPTTDMGMSKSDLWIDESTGYIIQSKSTSEVAGASSTSTLTYSKFDETIDPPIEKPTNIMTMPEIPTVAIP